MKTSILSKRWNNLWTSVSNLDFDDASLYSNEIDGRDPPDESRFMNFVERVLLFLDTSNIQKFRLSCRVCFNPSRIHSWVSSAIQHNVHELDLCLFVDDPFVLPQSIFSSISLTTLKIEMNCVLQIPSFTKFPNLKTLHLSLITFPDDDSTQNLFSGCLVLEELVILDCEWTNLKNIMISIPTLKKLTIDDLPYFGPPIDFKGCRVMINAPNLVFLKYTGYLWNEILLCGVLELVKADIGVSILHEREKEVACHVVDLLKGIQNVGCLKVSKSTIESLVFAGKTVFNNLPVCKNLTHLELSMEIGYPAIRALMKFLNFCPNLQSLNFTEGFDYFKHDICRVKLDFIWLSPPKCIISSLKTLTFKKFHGHKTEICFLKFILKHELVCNKMDIFWCENPLGDQNWRQEVKNTLETIARGSTSCVITWR